jgi:ubiquinone/menaquinone biosynthesis C-methylase UbiE
MTDRGDAAQRTHEYELGHSDWELKRLGDQARLINPITRQYFLDAGIVPGMRILDVGAGAGDTALLAAEIVGSSGEIVGTDRSPVAVAAAQTRVVELGRGNISFREGDPADLTFEEPFDAIVGRYVLMFNPNPDDMLRRIVRHLRPGGIVVFQEPDWRGACSAPPSPLYNHCIDFIVRTFGKIGTNASMGLTLYSTFIRAGLPPPTMGLRALVGGGANDLSGVGMIADLVVTMAHSMEEMGVVSREELDVHTLKQRMIAEAESLGSVVVCRYEVGAWSRRQ